MKKVLPTLDNTSKLQIGIFQLYSPKFTINKVTILGRFDKTCMLMIKLATLVGSFPYRTILSGI